MDDTELIELIRARSNAMEPLPTDEQARLQALDDVRAVLFDVYGTLVTSGSGDVGTAEKSGKGAAFVEALAAVGLTFDGDGDLGVSHLIETIRHHQAANEDAEYPEIDITRAWHQLLQTEKLAGRVSGSVDLDEPDLDRLAIEYETRVNPVWPMPKCRETIDAFRDSGRMLGIVSNAQFFTPLLFPALLGEPLEGLGFDPGVQFYSYRFLQAKPGTFLYERAREAVVERGLEPEQVLYVGNDLLNDVMPAARVGFRTALFAGDGRSLRWREGDERVNGVEPDLVVTRLDQLLACVDDG